MKCESVDSDSREWIFEDELKIGCWNGKLAQLYGSDPSIQNVYHRAKSSFHEPARGILSNYYSSNDESYNSFNDPSSCIPDNSSNSSSSSSDADRETAQKEADEHFTRSQKALIDAVAHSAAAGLALEICPPLAVYEGYKAVEAWKESAQEYNAGTEAEKKAQE